MSEKEIVNGGIIFQSFSKNYNFESNQKTNKKLQNENIEFTFGKNRFLDKLEESSPKSKERKNIYNEISSFNEQTMNIYSKNDNNILESGHFGKSKYESKKYKNIIENNSIIKKPSFFIEEKISGKYSKPNLNSTKIENEDAKLLNIKLKNLEIRKVKSNVKIVNSNINKFKKNVSYKQKKVKKLKEESFQNYKVNINESNNIDKNLNILKGSNPLVTRLKKMKNNNHLYNDFVDNAINRTNNNFVHSQIFEKEINNKNHSFIQIPGFNYSNKIRKSAPGILINNQPKLNKNSNINTLPKKTSRNPIIHIENKENVPININNFKNKDFLYNPKPINLNNTVMACSHKRISQYNPKRISKAKNRYENKVNVIRKSSDNYIKLNETRFNDNRYDILLSTQMNFGNILTGNKIPRSNRNKNNQSIVCNKVNSMYNKSIAMIKPKKNQRKIAIAKNIIPNDIIMIKSYFINNNF